MLSQSNAEEGAKQGADLAGQVDRLQCPRGLLRREHAGDDGVAGAGGRGGLGGGGGG